MNLPFATPAHVPTCQDILMVQLSKSFCSHCRRRAVQPGALPAHLPVCVLLLPQGRRLRLPVAGPQVPRPPRLPQLQVCFLLPAAFTFNVPLPLCHASVFIRQHCPASYLLLLWAICHELVNLLKCCAVSQSVFLPNCPLTCSVSHVQPRPGESLLLVEQVRSQPHQGVGLQRQRAHRDARAEGTGCGKGFA